jgi:hypothetical protein
MGEKHSILNTSGISKELRLILEILSNDTRNIEGYLSNIPENMDWELFLELAIHHRLYPNLAVKLPSLSTSNIPQFVINEINKYYQQNTFLMLQLSSEMGYINNLFNKNQILTLFLKGPILATELYGDISLRTSSDIDLLVQIKDLELVEELLLKDGYVKDEYIQSILNDWKWRHHHFTYVHPMKNIKIEVHWRLNPGPGIEPSFQFLWSRKETSSYFEKSIYYLCHVDLFYFLVTHGARHGWSRLRWLVDIDHLLNKGIDLQVLMKFVRKYHVESIGKQAIILTRELLGTKTPDERIDRQSIKLAQQAIFYMERMVNLHTEPVPKEVVNHHKRHLFALMSNYHKVAFGLSTLFPYPEDAVALPLPKYLHFLYFPLRPFIWLWRKTRKYAFS